MTEKYGFVYIWRDKKRKMYYIGSHWGTEDDGYICSSNRMRNAYRRRPTDFKRKILFRSNCNLLELLEQEEKWLKKAEKNKKRYYNHMFITIKNNWVILGKEHHFLGKKHSEETKQKIKEKRSKQIITEEHKKKISEKLTGINRGIRTEQHKLNLSKSLKGVNGKFWNGKKHSEESKNKMSKTRKGFAWWNNGIVSTISPVRPGENYVRGRITWR